MAVHARIQEEAFTALPEDLQGHYKKSEDGAYVLDVVGDGSFELVDTAGLKAALKSERKKVTDASKKLTSLEKRFKDLDPDVARDALSKVSEMDDWDPDQRLSEHKERFEKQVSQRADADRKKLIEKHTAEVKAAQVRAQLLQRQLEGELVRSAAHQECAKLKGNPALLLPIVERSAKMVESTDGRYEVVIVDDSGDTRISPRSGSTSNMTIGELLEEMRGHNDYQMAFEGRGQTGGGTPPASPGSLQPGVNPFSRKHFNLTQAAELETSNPAEAKRLKALAATEG